MRIRQSLGGQRYTFAWRRTGLAGKGQLDLSAFPLRLATANEVGGCDEKLSAGAGAERWKRSC